MTPAARGVSLAVVAALAGCSLVYSSELNDARMLPAGPDSADGGTPREEGGADPVSDAADAGDGAGAARGCAAMKPAPRYCRDFDDGAPLDADGWETHIDPAGKQLLETDTTSAYSPPGSLHVGLRGAPDCSYARIVRAFPGVSDRVDMRVRVRPAAPWSDSDGIMITHFDDDSSQRCAAILYAVDENGDGRMDRAQVNVQTTGDNDVRNLQGVAQVDEWTEVGLVATPAAGGGVSMVFSFRAEDGSYAETTHVFQQCTLAGTMRAKIGFHCESGTADVRYDDLRVDW